MKSLYGIIYNELDNYVTKVGLALDMLTKNEWINYVMGIDGDEQVNYAPLIQGDNSSGIICAVKLNEGIKRFANIACVFEVNDKQFFEHIGSKFQIEIKIKFCYT